jgi:hypothetical protein
MLITYKKIIKKVNGVKTEYVIPFGASLAIIQTTTGINNAQAIIAFGNRIQADTFIKCCV